MERETKTVITPAGKELVLKAYLTAGERNQLRGIYLSKMKLDADGKPNTDSVDGSVVDLSEQKLIELAVISYGEVKENVLTTLLNTKPAEYDFVVSECARVNGGDLTSAK